MAVRGQDHQLLEPDSALRMGIGYRRDLRSRDRLDAPTQAAAGIRCPRQNGKSTPSRDHDRTSSFTSPG
jgi:hypothetical protein